MTLGQIVIGSPGSGKTTYCHGLSHFFELSGRKTAVVNLDPANDSLPYHLTNLKNLNTEGRNRGLVYCMDYLEKNLDWPMAKLEPFADHYLLFDFPEQVELFTLHNNAKNVISEMTSKWDYHLTAVYLVDTHVCSDPGEYVGALLLSLSAMLHLELPHINVLSKIDLIESYGKLSFNLDFYTDVHDKNPHSAKYRKLTKNLCEVIEDFSLVNFTTLNIEDKESVTDLVRLIDKSNGYVCAGMEVAIDAYIKISAGPLNWDYDRTAALQEKYIKDEDDHEG